MLLNRVFAEVTVLVRPVAEEDLKGRSSLFFWVQIEILDCLLFPACLYE